MTCDLHVHSTYSDGTLTPKEIVSLAKEKGLSAVALTDHNSVKGLTDFFKEGKVSDINLVGGVEISTEYMDTELHILGLFIPQKNYKQIEEYTDLCFQEKRKSNIDLCNKIRSTGVDITYEEVEETVPTGKVNRANIASVLVKKGYAASIRSAFEKYLYKKAGFYTPAKKPSTIDVIKLINSIGAVSVWAHPFLNVKDSHKMEAMLKDFKDSGIDAIEVFYSKYSEETTRTAVALAEKYTLLCSGGSDFHGDNKPDIELGSGKGNLNIPFQFYQKLYKRSLEKSKL